MPEERIITTLQAQLPGLLAVYVFGSRAQAGWIDPGMADVLRPMSG